MEGSAVVVVPLVDGWSMVVMGMVMVLGESPLVGNHGLDVLKYYEMCLNFNSQVISLII